MCDAQADTVRALWFRCDLRLDDHPALAAASDNSQSLLPIYVFDPCKFIDTTYAGARKSSARRARFLLQSVADLRQKLEVKGSGLAVAIEDPAVFIPALCKDVSEIYVTRGICSEETHDELRVENSLTPSSKLCRFWGNSLYFPDECGCDLAKPPLLYSNFRKRAEVFGRIREPLEEPATLPPLPECASLQEFCGALNFLPTLEELGFEEGEIEDASLDDPRGVLPFIGGEHEGRARVQRWIWDDDHLQEYKVIRNGMKGEAYSSKFSPWLALGCLSPRRIWKEVRRYEQERTRNKSTYWLIFELIWRDFFMYMALGYGVKIFRSIGITGSKKRSWTGSIDALERWKKGETGDVLVDANMRELLATGWMSNRGRQNVASFLIFDLRVDWRFGAAHFEEHLLDYDPCSNWGNWVAAAGLTSQNVKRFNTKYQLERYDPTREYVSTWLSVEIGYGDSVKVDDFDDKDEDSSDVASQDVGPVAANLYKESKTKATTLTKRSSKRRAKQ